jgi:hypothetical protein
VAVTPERLWIRLEAVAGEDGCQGCARSCRGNSEEVSFPRLPDTSPPALGSQVLVVCPPLPSSARTLAFFLPPLAGLLAGLALVSRLFPAAGNLETLTGALAGFALGAGVSLLLPRFAPAGKPLAKNPGPGRRVAPATEMEDSTPVGQDQTAQTEKPRPDKQRNQ